MVNGKTSITYFCLGEMPFTPFGKGNSLYEDLGGSILRQEGIEATLNPWRCDIIVTNKYPLRLPTFLKKSRLAGLIKPILVWTHEPRYCRLSTKVVGRQKLMPRVYVMNVHTGDLYLNNYSFYSWAIQFPKLNIDTIEAEKSVRTRPIAALISHVSNRSACSFIKDNENLDLCVLRQEIALAGYARNLVEIYGKGWPSGISKEDSRDDWHDRKLAILRSYRFNLCLENTTCDYYCTEKIWDAIRAGCLPIYYGKNNRIYDDFPTKSFVDVADYPSVSELLDYVETMTREEYRNRLSRCVNVYNRFLERNHFNLSATVRAVLGTRRLNSSWNNFAAEYERAVLSTVKRIKALVLPAIGDVVADDRIPEDPATVLLTLQSKNQPGYRRAQAGH